MLQIRLLGQFDVRLDGKRILIPSRAGQSLLAYLVLTAGTAHRREKLAGLFWPALTDENARKNLRHDLWRIRKAVSAQNSNPGDYLLVEEFTIAFNRNAEYWLDVAQVERPDLDLESLTSNLSLYVGELLPGFYEDWIVLERERIQSIFDAKMEQLLAQLVAAERWTAVQEQAERWLGLGNTLEPAYRALMLAYGARGDMARVSSIYQRCISELDEKFGLEPSPETRALYDGLLRGTHVLSRAAQPSSTVTFLFTDIEESTNLLDILGEQYAAVLAEHHQVLRAAIQKWNGREVDTQGDAFFVTFSRASDAVQCAADAQRALASHPWPHQQPLCVRMGLHTGEPLIASTGYVGMDVHRAARIGDAAHGGQVLLSQTTRELVMHDLPQGVKLRDLGEVRLKDLRFPTPIYQLVIEGMRNDFPPLRTKFAGTEAPTPGDPPFKGLQYFEEADSELFFGREILTAKLVNRLRETKFLSIIIGASGSGKSSLVRAGLIPVLKKGEALVDGMKPPEGSSDWRVHIITPTAHPLQALATELTSASASVTAAATLIDDLMQDPRSLALYLARQRPKRHTLLVLDQFEELFTLCRDEFEREAFIDNLLTTLSQSEGNITLILTLRADFYAHLAQYPELRDAVAKQQEYIGPMTTEELRRAIEEPAKRGHWAFEPGLVDLILRDVGDEPGALPLLSHALLETWKRRAGHTLTLEGYADAGGVRGAIAHTAESVYQNLSSEEQTIARDIFLRLTELGEGTEDTRRRAPLEELMSSSEDANLIRAVLNKLAEARLVTLAENTAEVAHEALIREWPTLREWLDQDREGLRLHRRLTEAAQEWELLERDPGGLYRGAPLAQAREWAALHPKTLNAAERLFLNASNELEQHEAREREEQQRRELEAAQKLAETEKARAEEQTQSANRLRMRNRLISSVGTVAIIMAILAGLFGFKSNQNAIQAGTNFQRAEAQRLAAEANKLLLSGGNSELIALLSLRSIGIQYTPQGDSALGGAANLNYPRQQFSAHEDRIVTVAYSPDGKYVLTGSRDKTARLWETQTGKEVSQFIGHTDAVASVAFSPDGQYVLTGSADKTARLWETQTGKEVRQFLGHTDGIASVAFSPDGQYVLTGSSDNTARLWDVETGQEVRAFIGHTDKVRSVAFSPDGKQIFTGSWDQTTRLWDTSTGREIRQFMGPSSQVYRVTLSSDGITIAAGSNDGTIWLWDVLSGQKLQQFGGGTMAFSPDGKTLIASGGNTILQWDVQTGEELPGAIGYTEIIQSLTFSPDGKYILTGSWDGIARLWDAAPSPELPSLNSPSGVNAVIYSPDGRFSLTGDGDGVARLWNAKTGQKLREFIGHSESINYGVAFSPDGKYILTGSWDKTARLWDVMTGKELHTFVTMGPVNGVAFSPDGKYVLAASDDKNAWIWDAVTGQEVRKFPGGGVGINGIQRAVVSPNGKYVATASTDGTARIWDVSTGQELHRFNIGSAVNSVAFSPDGKNILTTSQDKFAQLWDIQTGKEVRRFVGHTEVIWTAILSSDGRYVGTASADGTARIWDAVTGQELRRLVATGPLNSLAFSPDSRYLLTSSGDGAAQQWDVDYHTTVSYLCSRLVRDFTEDERVQFDISDQNPTCPTQ